MSQENQGYISLHRKVMQNFLFKEKRAFSKFEAWLYLLMNANHTDTKVLLGNQLINVKKGSFITSEIKLMAEFSWSKSKLRTFLSLLESQSMIEKVTDSKKTTLTIVKYSDYQEHQTAKKPQKNRKPTAKELRSDTDNNENNDNKDNNENNITNPTEVELVMSTQKRFIIPLISEISTYCKERNNEVNPEQFYDHYQSNGWMVGKNKMKDWKAAVRTWEKNGYSKPHQSNNNQITTQNGTPQERKYAHVYKAIRNLERLGSLNTEQIEVAKRYLEHATGNIDTTEFIGKLVKYDSRNAKSDFEDIRDSLRIGE